MNPHTLRDEAESLRTDPRGLGVYSGRVAAHADAWDDDLIAWCDTAVRRNELEAENVNLRQRLEVVVRWAKALHLDAPSRGWAGIKELHVQATDELWDEWLAALAAGVCSECGTGGWKHTRDCTVPFGEG